jgi:hypothetical protein
MLDMSVPTGNLSEKKKENYIEGKTKIWCLAIP